MLPSARSLLPSLPPFSLKRILNVYVSFLHAHTHTYTCMKVLEGFLLHESATLSTLDSNNKAGRSPLLPTGTLPSKRRAAAA